MSLTSSSVVIKVPTVAPSSFSLITIASGSTGSGVGIGVGVGVTAPSLTANVPPVTEEEDEKK